MSVTIEHATSYLSELKKKDDSDLKLLEAASDYQANWPVEMMVRELQRHKISIETPIHRILKRFKNLNSPEEIKTFNHICKAWEAYQSVLKRRAAVYFDENEAKETGFVQHFFDSVTLTNCYNYNVWGLHFHGAAAPVDHPLSLLNELCQGLQGDFTTDIEAPNSTDHIDRSVSQIKAHRKKIILLRNSLLDYQKCCQHAWERDRDIQTRREALKETVHQRMWNSVLLLQNVRDQSAQDPAILVEPVDCEDRCVKMIISVLRFIIEKIEGQSLQQIQQIFKTEIECQQTASNREVVGVPAFTEQLKTLKNRAFYCEWEDRIRNVIARVKGEMYKVEVELESGYEDVQSGVAMLVAVQEAYQVFKQAHDEMEVKRKQDDEMDHLNISQLTTDVTEAQNSVSKITATKDAASYVITELQGVDIVVDWRHVVKQLERSIHHLKERGLSSSYLSECSKWGVQMEQLCKNSVVNTHPSYGGSLSDTCNSYIGLLQSLINALEAVDQDLASELSVELVYRLPESLPNSNIAVDTRAFMKSLRTKLATRLDFINNGAMQSPVLSKENRAAIRVGQTHFKQLEDSGQLPFETVWKELVAVVRMEQLLETALTESHNDDLAVTETQSEVEQLE